jgi:signal peptidase I
MDVSLESNAPLPAASLPAPSAPALDQTLRETVESIVVAMILAFLFRGVVAEAFVIPTGSMAPALQGRHMDVVCPQCRHQYRTGASVENTEFGAPRGEVRRTRCPICRFALQLDKERDANHRSFNGDRILVSKFAYQLFEPQRWDVIVFRYPGDAKTPYIKRLVGLPGETIRIRHGDIYRLNETAPEQRGGLPKYAIVRKSPDKLLAMLQLVDDTQHVARQLQRADWPSRWTPHPPGSNDASCWRTDADGSEFQVAAGNAESWLRYRHFIPRPQDWRDVVIGEKLQLEGYQGQLITDYYAYNDSSAYTDATDWGAQSWVGDLAVELNVAVLSSHGELLLDLVEGGRHHRCIFDLATGSAVLDNSVHKTARGDQGDSRLVHATAPSSLRGPGKYQVRFANVDDQLFVWVNGRLLEFDAPTTFESPPDVAPRWSKRDSGDLAPVGVGARNAELRVTRMRVLRDVYYRAVEPVDPYKDSEYDRSLVGYGFDVGAVMSQPELWSSTPLFRARRAIDYRLGADQFFPLGDNSPESRDARLWSEQRNGLGEVFPPPFVSRELLIGKALVIYWPHAWRIGGNSLPVIPNFQRMGRIR